MTDVDTHDHLATWESRRDFFDNPGLPYRLMPIFDTGRWEVQVSGSPFAQFEDFYIAERVFFLVQRSFELGRQSAFCELRQLIGARGNG